MKWICQGCGKVHGKPQPDEPYLPFELRAVEEQLANKDGRVRFRLRWDVLYKLGKTPYTFPKYCTVRGKISTWSCATVDELIWAIERVTQDLKDSPGVKQEWGHRGMPDSVRCPVCGQNKGHAIDHNCLGGIRAMAKLKKQISAWNKKVKEKIASEATGQEESPAVRR